VEVDVLKEIGTTISSYPKDLNVHPNLKRIIASRGKSVIEDTGVDMSTAEALAFGTLVKEGYHIRVSGQDVERGTFSQRHAVLHDQKTEAIYVPLMHVKGEKAGSFVICNSSLSEYGVMGFEYGYSLSSPEALVMCEMQFGDFANVYLCMILLTAERSMYYRSIPCFWRGEMATTFRSRLVNATRL
jgi:2-oxoglutarate dehydrogenase E1 component